MEGEGEGEQETQETEDHMDYQLEYCFYLWNPATKLTSKQFPHLHLDDNVYHMFSFGYDNLSNTYKVVAFYFDSKANEGPQKVQVKICSFGDRRWRSIDSFLVPFDKRSFVLMMNDGVYFIGTLNWLALCNNCIWDDTSTIAQRVIVSLDLGTKTYKQLLLPRVDEAP